MRRGSQLNSHWHAIGPRLVVVSGVLAVAGCTADAQRVEQPKPKTGTQEMTAVTTLDPANAQAPVTKAPVTKAPVTKAPDTKEPVAKASAQAAETSQVELATFGAGCFWCVEAVFQQLEGVAKVESGYTGGDLENPTYRDISNGDTGHAEVCQITFVPSKIRFEELLEVFWQTHDPTTLNQQGHDIGTQYRSAIFYHSDQQRDLAEKYKRELDAAGAFNARIVTEIIPFTKFYKAENYHQNYFRENPYEGYCRAVIQPKVEKFKKVFGSKLKKESTP